MATQDQLPIGNPATPPAADSAIARGHLRLACYELADRLNRGTALNREEVQQHAEKIFAFCMPGESARVDADPAPAATTSATGESGAARKR